MIKNNEIKWKPKNNNLFLNPIIGEPKTLESLKDGMFSEKTLGNGYAIVPTKGYIYSPVAGEITVASDTKHSYGIKEIGTKNEYLIHIGFNTVELDGVGFVSHVKQGELVEAGQLIGEVKLKLLKKMNIDTTTMIIATSGKVPIKPKSHTNIVAIERE